MNVSTILRAALVTMVLACAPLAAGCMVEAEDPSTTVVDGYAPPSYEGYVVYYDDYGRPYYYNDGVVMYVPQTYVHYNVLVRNYHTYRPQYRRWYTRHGYRYRTYRYRTYRRR